VASEARYRASAGVADAVGPTGRLALLLALARYTGRRLNACLQLTAADVLRTPAAAARALARAGPDAREADHMPHGTLVWAAEHDKQGYAAVTPLSAPARAALDAYLARAPRVGDAPRFPSQADAARPMRKAEASHLLTRAEARAELPHLDRGQFHPYRRLWASERKHLPDVDVARAGGWRDLSVIRTSYQQADAVTTLRVVEHGTRTPGGSSEAAAEHGIGHRGHRTDTAAG
jgi:hypothetical protein